MEQNNWEIDSYINIEAREREGLALGLPTWMVPLWDGIHAWAAGFGAKAMKKHVEITALRGRIPSQEAAVVLISMTVERALRRERETIRQTLLEAMPTQPPEYLGSADYTKGWDAAARMADKVIREILPEE